MLGMVVLSNAQNSFPTHLIYASKHFYSLVILKRLNESLFLIEVVIINSLGNINRDSRANFTSKHSVGV